MSSLSNEQLSKLKLLTSNAGVEASSIFSKWLRTSVTIKMDNAELIPFEDVVAKAGGGDEISIGLYMSIDKGISGSVLFMFNEKSAFELIDILIGRELGSTKKIGEMEKSALQETANIVGCAYLNSIGTNMGATIVPSPPVLIHDLTQSIMDTVLMEQAQFQNESLFIQTEFYSVHGKLDWNFFFLPIMDSLSELFGQ